MTSPAELESQFTSQFGKDLEVLPEFRGEQSWRVRLNQLHAVMVELKKSGFNYLVDISSVDHLGSDGPRFELVYELFSYQTRDHLRVKSWLEDDEEPVAPTVIDLWRTADWHEREIYDMMGIHFEGHPDLRRILMWDGYPYFPLRKDFPLEGKPTNMPDIAFTRPAPLEGGPFVTSTESQSHRREPRAKKVTS
ncbi:MAG: NADH-quinone oxidoreductase subunit C [Verrucomicrobiota bacterium]